VLLIYSCFASIPPRFAVFRRRFWHAPRCA
jgi:hypothetical protein